MDIGDWEKWFPEFQTNGDPELERMKQESLRFGREAYDWRNKNHSYPEQKSEFKPRWLSLLGPSGTGKTMLARKVAQRFPFSFKLWLDIASVLRAGHHDEFMSICKQEILIIDDVFSEYRTDFSDAKLCEFFTRRENKWTMVTANVSMETIAGKYDQRIASRMIRHNSVVIDVDLPDWNLRRACPQTDASTTAST